PPEGSGAVVQSIRRSFGWPGRGPVLEWDQARNGSDLRPLSGGATFRRPPRTLRLLEAAWPLAVGPELARRTEVLGIEGGTLRVRVPDAGWRKVLHRMQPQILGHLREIAGDLAPKRMGFVDGGFQRRPRGGVQGGAATGT